VGLLIGASLFTWGFGGLIYWLARRRHSICPRCGLAWERSSRALSVTAPEPKRRLMEEQPDERLPSAGLRRRVFGTTMVLLASLIVLIGFVEWEMAAVAVGSVLGGGGSLTFYWGWQGLQGRRKAIVQGLQRKILRLASARGGTLTVTEVAADLNLALPAAEKILESMDDGFRVRSEISNEGVIFYEFPEIRYRSELGLPEGSGEGATGG
jgi:hypothetical protein